MAATRRYFEHNMWLLSEKKIHVTEDSARMMKGLRAARYAPNRRVNLHTIDESARVMANSAFSLLGKEEEL